MAMPIVYESPNPGKDRSEKASWWDTLCRQENFKIDENNQHHGELP